MQKTSSKMAQEDRLPALNALRAFEAALHGEALPEIDRKFLQDGKLA